VADDVERVTFEGDPQPLIDAAKKASKALEDFSGQARATGSAIEGFTQAIVSKIPGASQAMGVLEGVVGKLGPAGMVAAAGIGVAATAVGAITGRLAIATKQLLDYSDRISELSQKTGVSTSALQELEYAAKLSGTSLESVTGTIARMQNALSKGSAAFSKIGLSAQVLKTMKPEDAFQKVADTISAMSNASDRAAAAIAIFGRSGTQLLPMIEGLAQARDRARDLGYVIDESAVKGAGRLRDKLDEIGMAWDRAWMQIVSGIGESPEMQQALEEVVLTLGHVSKWAQDNKDLLADVWSDVGSAIRDIMPIVRELVEMLGDAARFYGVMDKLTTGRAPLPEMAGAGRTGIFVNGKPVGRSTGGKAPESPSPNGLLTYGIGGMGDFSPMMGNAAPVMSGVMNASERRQIEESQRKTESAMKRQLEAINDELDALNAAAKAWDDIELKSDLAARNAWMNAKGSEAFSARIGGAAGMLDEAISGGKGEITQETTSVGTAAAESFEKAMATIKEAQKAGVKFSGDIWKKGWKDQAKYAEEALRKMAAGVKTWSQTWADLPSVIMGAIQGGGNVGGAIGATIGSTIGSKVGDGLSKTLGKTLGGVLGKLAPGVGTLLGGFLGKGLGKVVGGLFGGGPSIEEIRADTLKDSLPKLEEGLGKINSVLEEINKKELSGLARQFEYITSKVSKSIAAMQSSSDALKGLGTRTKQTSEQRAKAIEELAKKEKLSIDEATEKYDKLYKRNERARQEELAKQKELQTRSKADLEMAQKQLDYLGIIGAAAIGQMQKEGKNLVEIMEQLGPSFDAAMKAIKDSETAMGPGKGLELGGIFGDFANFRNLVNENQELVNAATSLGDVIAGLRSTGNLTFTEFQASMGYLNSLFGDLIAKGFSEQQALTMLGPALLQIQKLAGQFGFAIDADTQKLLDLANSSGTLEGLKDPLDVVNETLGVMTQILAELAKVFGATLPESVNKYIDALNRAGAAGLGVGAGPGGGGQTSPQPGPGNTPPPGMGKPPGYEVGTPGFLDFDRETSVNLHGKEMVVPYTQSGFDMMREYVGGQSGQVAVTVNVSNPGASADQIAAAVERVIVRNRNGVGRSVTDYVSSGRR